MMKHSPLQIGDVMLISPSAWRRAEQEFPHPHQYKLRLGHAVQYTHDGEFAAAGLSCVPSPKAELFDRTFEGMLQDDKVATFFDREGGLKDTATAFHSISHPEYLRWSREIREFDRDVVIHSFEFTDPEHTVFKYMGAISFWRAKNFLKQNQNDGTWSLRRENAYQHNLL